MPASSPPFIIWTLQRTGGTNLTQRLVERAGLPVTEHEPFNRDRVHWPVTRRWEQDGNREALAQGMREICSQPSIIKHCVEMVPWEITRALAQASSEAGFRHLFLYRQRPIDRLLSLHFARLSGIWGPRKKPGTNDASGNDEFYAEPLPVADLVSHETRCATLLRNTWEALLARGEDPIALAFEAVYAQPDASQAEQAVMGLLQSLGLAEGAASDRRFTADVLQKGNQGTRQDYSRFQGLPALERAVGRVAPFVPAPALVACTLDKPETPPPWVRLATVELPEPLLPRRTRLSGLVVKTPAAPAGLVLRLEGGPQAEPALRWDLASAWAAQKFPRCPNAANARYAAEGLRLGGTLSLVLHDPATGETQTCATLRCESPSPAALAEAVERALAQPPDLLRHGSLRRALERVPVEARDAAWHETVLLLDAHHRQAPEASFERLRQLRSLAGDAAAPAFQALTARLRGVLGEMTLSAHGYTQAMGGRDAGKVWRELQRLAARIEAMAGAPCFINSGTLLGAIRDGALIPHDDDVDLAVLLPADSAESAARAWTALKRSLAAEKLLNREFDARVRSHAKVGQAGGASVDLFPAWIADGRVHVWPYACGEVAAEALLPLRPLDIGGTTLAVPQQPQALLALNYGPGWTHPDPGWRFDWPAARARFTAYLSALPALDD